MLRILIELQRLKGLERTGWMLRGLPGKTESVAAHSFGVATAAMLLADVFVERGGNINSERVLRMALLHDWAECRVGDLPKTATEYFRPEVRRHAESKAFADIVASLNDSDRLWQVYLEYEERTSDESQIVKAADIVDLLVQVLALERAGAKGLDEFWEVMEQANFESTLLQEILTEVFEALRQLRQALNG